MRRLRLILVGILAGALVAIAAFRPSIAFFLRLYPDCTPNQIDGQCGLATFMDTLYAAATSAFLFLIVAVSLSIFLLRRTRAPHPQ